MEASLNWINFREVSMTLVTSCLLGESVCLKKLWSFLPNQGRQEAQVFGTKKLIGGCGGRGKPADTRTLTGVSP